METALGLRFAFDLGTNSIGWAVYQLGERTNSLGQKETDVPVRLVDLGANLFSDGRAPKTGRILGGVETSSSRRQTPAGSIPATAKTCVESATAASASTYRRE